MKRRVPIRLLVLAGALALGWLLAVGVVVARGVDEPTPTEPVESCEPASVDPDTPIEPCPALRLAKAAVATPIVAGETATFELRLWNAGTAPAENVLLEDLLPAGVSWAIDAPDGVDCASSVGPDGAQSFSCLIGEIDPGEPSGAIVVRLTGATDREDCGSLTNVATATAENAPDAPAGAAASLVVRCPGLLLEKGVDAAQITISGPAGAPIVSPASVTWTLTWTVTDGPVTNAALVDRLPAGLVYVPGSASDGGVHDPATGTLSWLLPSVETSGSVTFRTTIDPTTISRVEPTVNVATITGDDGAAAEARARLGVAVDAPPLGGGGGPGSGPSPAPGGGGPGAPDMPDTATDAGSPSTGIGVAMILAAGLAAVVRRRPAADLR